MADQKKGTPILMKFFSDAFAAHLRTVSVNYTLHQYKLSVSPSGESDTDLLENAIRAIGNAKPAVTNSLMSTKQIMREPNLPKQMVDDFDLHAQWCQSTLEELDLCDATIRNAILSKDDYLAILSGALAPYYEAMGIPEDYPYPGDSEGGDDDDHPEDEEPDEDGFDAEDAPMIVQQEPEDDVPQPVVNPEPGEMDDPLLMEVLELRRQVELLLAQRNQSAMPVDSVEPIDDVPGEPIRMGSTERTVSGTTGVIGAVYELTDDGLVGAPVTPTDVITPDDSGMEPVEEPIEPEEPVHDVPETIDTVDTPRPRPTVRPMVGANRMVTLRHRERSADNAPNGLFTPEPAVEPIPTATSETPVTTIDDVPAYDNMPGTDIVPDVDDTPVPEPSVQPIDPYHQPEAPETDYAGLFGYDQYDEPDNPQPLAEDPVRLSAIAEKASEVIIAARKKSGRAATKSTGTSAKGKGKTTSKTGQKKTASKSTGRTTRSSKKTTEPSVTTDTESQSVEQTPSETPSDTTYDEQEDTQ